MPRPEPFLLFVRPLNQAGIRYVVTGSVAAAFYGQPRVTHDVDLVVFLGAGDILTLARAFPVVDFYLPPPEVLAAEAQREQRGHFNVIHLGTGFKADFYPTGRDDLNAWAFRSSRSVKVGEDKVVLAPPEYVIVRKLEYYREGGSEKHLRDIRAMLSISGPSLDWPSLNRWIEQRRLQPEWKLAAPEPGAGDGP